MTERDLKAFTWDAHRDAVAQIKKALTTADQKIRAADRRSDLFPGERTQLQEEARTEARTAVYMARQGLTAAVEAGKRLGRYVEAPETGETLTRRLLYATEAQAELAGQSVTAALAAVARFAEAGDVERGRAYAKAARGIAAQAGKSADLAEIEEKLLTVDERAHRAFSVAQEAVEAQLPWFDLHVEALLGELRPVSKDVRDGYAAETVLDTRALDMWQRDAEKEAARVYTRTSSELAGMEPPAWAVRERPGEEG